MVFHMIQESIPWIGDVNHWVDTWQAIHWHVPSDLFPSDLMVLDKQIQPTDLGGDIQKAADKFVKTGQAWAFLVGLILGYLLKTFTSFG